jgi:hypothetical protein
MDDSTHRGHGGHRGFLRSLRQRLEFLAIDAIIRRQQARGMCMAEKMSERTKILVVNSGVVAGLIWCYFKEYPIKIILIAGAFLLVFANILMYLKRR